jgi:hypothetical protein
MKRSDNIITKGELFSCLFMLFALLWLTISLPFVNYDQEFAQEQLTGSEEGSNSNQQNLPTEEKTESGANSLSEYLHDHHFEFVKGFVVLKGYKTGPDDTYLSYHPELVILPPEA